MNKEDIKTIVIIIVVMIIATVVLVKVRDVLSNNGEVTGRAVAEPESNNIKQAAPTPTSCTPGQNCGSPTCAVATGRGGGCGCGG